MNFIADENLFEPVIDYLKTLGHNIFSIRDENLSGTSDDEIYRIACEENKAIITMDKDFSKVVRYPAKNCGGIILVKIYRRTVDETLNIFKSFFEKIKPEDIKENLIIMTPHGFRIRRSKN